MKTVSSAKRYLLLLSLISVVSCRGGAVGENPKDERKSQSADLENESGLPRKSLGSSDSTVDLDEIISGSRLMVSSDPSLSEIPDDDLSFSSGKPEKFLSDFTKGKLLENNDQQINGIKYVLLKELSPQQIKILVDKTSNLSSRYALVTKKFWNKIAELQSQKIKVGFFSGEKKDTKLGYYFSNERLILLYPLGSMSSLVHEGRHAEQFDALKKMARHSFLGDQISQECLAVLAKNFGEIDATLYELGKIQDTLDELPTVGEIPIRSIGLIKVPTIIELQKAINYIDDSSRRMQKAVSICPRELQYFIKAFAIDSATKKNRLSDLGVKLYKLMSSNTQKIVGRLEWTAKASDPNERARQESRYEKAIQEFKMASMDLQTEMTEEIKKELELVPRSMREYLAQEVIGISFYIKK